MPPEHPFEKLTRGHNHVHRLEVMANTAFEEGKVAYVMKVFKMNVRLVGKTLRDDEADVTGNSDLTFRAFDTVFPTFPIYLGASRLGGVQLHLEQSAMLPALFKSFGAAPFVEAYDAFYESAATRVTGRPVGLIFPRKGFKNGLVVYAADDPQVLPLCERETVLTYASGKRKDRHWIMVRSFQKLLEAIHNGGHGWRPDRD